MKTINLAQALKQKKRLAGESTRLRNIVTRENSRKESTPARANVRASFDAIVATARQLAALKGAISAANAGAADVSRGIYGKLNLQAELRGLIAFVNELPTKEGEEVERIGFLSRDEAAKTVFVAEIKQDEVDLLKREFQQEIETLQDEIDEFNAATRISVA